MESTTQDSAAKTIDPLMEPVAALTPEMIYPITWEGAALARDGSPEGTKMWEGKRQDDETALSH